MLKNTVGTCVTAAVLALVLATSSASAQATRTWVSGVGDDANPCSRTAPCKTFAGAISKTAPGGEIDALDPGGFGAVTITKSITIDGGPGAGGILNSLTNGVIINAAATDTITLRRINFQGAGNGLNGVRVLAAGAVNIEQCIIANNTGKGIDAQPTTVCKLFVSDTIIRGNTNVTNGFGIFLKPAVGVNVVATLNRVQLDRNTIGLRAEDRTNTSARDSSFSGNNTDGVLAISSTAILNLDNCTVSKNGTGGLHTQTSATIRFGKCMIVDNNGVGLNVDTGSLISFTNNSVAGNGSGNGPLGTTIPLQ